MNIKPILKYPGAKWSIASWITSFFPEHTHYLEPYAGSAAVFFQKEPALHEVLNDINGDLVNLFTVIRTRGDELASHIELTPWAEAEYQQYRYEYAITDDALENARQFLIRCWQGHGAGLDHSVGWRHAGRAAHSSPTQLWKRLPERILATIARLKDAEIRNKPALEMIAYYNLSDCLIYADPPYPLETRHGKMYQHEMTTSDHAGLLAALDEHSGPVILSGYSHPMYEEKLHHWIRVTKTTFAERGNSRQEVLWLNPRAARCKQLPMFESEAV